MFYNRNNDNSTLLQLLMEAEFRVLLEAKSPAEIKAKLGIKKNDISDEDFKKILDAAGNNRPLVVGMVKYYQEVKNIDLIIGYIVKYNGLEIQQPLYDKHPTFKGFTEAVDKIEGEKNIGQEVSGFGLDTTPPDYQTADGTYRVYEAHGKVDCIKYGKGYTFCISDSGLPNMYYYYRRGQQSKYYFVFDLNLTPEENEYITVVDAHPDGKFEFTHKDNDTPKTSKEYDYSLDVFLSTKHGLSELEDIFKPAPMSKEEKEKLDRFDAIQRSVEEQMALTAHPDALIDYIQHGYTLNQDVIISLSNKMFVQYINRTPIIEFKCIENRPPNVMARYFKVVNQNNIFDRLLGTRATWFSLLGSVYSQLGFKPNLKEQELVDVMLAADDIKRVINDFKDVLKVSSYSGREEFLKNFLGHIIPRDVPTKYYNQESIEHLCSLLGVYEDIDKSIKLLSQSMSRVVPPKLGVAYEEHINNSAEEFLKWCIEYGVKNGGERKAITSTAMTYTTKGLMDGSTARTAEKQCEHPGYTYIDSNPVTLYATLMMSDYNGQKYTILYNTLMGNPMFFLQHPETMEANKRFFELANFNIMASRYKGDVEIIPFCEVARRFGVKVSQYEPMPPNVYAQYLNDAQSLSSRSAISAKDLLRKYFIRELLTNPKTLETGLRYIKEGLLQTPGAMATIKAVNEKVKQKTPVK
jgi:hypothetical protein